MKYGDKDMDELTRVITFVNENWDGSYLTRFDHSGFGVSFYRTTLHSPDGPVVWTKVNADGTLEDVTRRP